MHLENELDYRITEGQLNRGIIKNLYSINKECIQLTLHKRSLRVTIALNYRIEN